MYYIILFADDNSSTVVTYNNGCRAMFRNLEVAKLMADRFFDRDDLGKSITSFAIAEEDKIIYSSLDGHEVPAN